MAVTPSRPIVVITITDFSTVYPTEVPAFPTLPAFTPTSAGLSVSASATSVPAPASSNSPDPVSHHKPFNIESLTPLFITISCIALLLLFLFAYVVWSKCCIGGRFGFGFECAECKVMSRELEQWKNGEKKRITREMVKQREADNDGSSVTAAQEPAAAAYQATDGNSNSDSYNTHGATHNRTADFENIDIDRDIVRADTLAALEGRPQQGPRITSASTSNSFWTSVKSHFNHTMKGKPRPSTRPPSDIETGDRFFTVDPYTAPTSAYNNNTNTLYSSSIYSRPNFDPYSQPPRPFTEYSSPGIPLHPLPLKPRTSEDAPKTYSAYLTTDYAPRDKERKILLAEGGLDSRAYKAAEAAMTRGSIASAELQRQVDVVNRVDREVQRARHPSQYSPSKEQLPEPGEFEDY